MVSSVNGSNPDVISNYITVQSAAKYSKYNQQYLQKLLRGGVFKTKRIGQDWLFEMDSLDLYLHNAENNPDRRCGPM